MILNIKIKSLVIFSFIYKANFSKMAIDEILENLIMKSVEFSANKVVC